MFAARSDSERSRRVMSASWRASSSYRVITRPVQSIGRAGGRESTLSIAGILVIPGSTWSASGHGPWALGDGLLARLLEQRDGPERSSASEPT